MEISVWKRKPQTHLISIIDLIFPIFMLVLHTYNFSVQGRRDVEVFRGLIDIEMHWGVYVLIWITAYLGNILEFYIALRLFLALKPDYADAQLVLTRCWRWLQLSSIISLILLIKILMYMVYLGIYTRLDAIGLIVCLVDIIFRMVSVYVVKRFVDDLKTQVPPPQPSVFFFNSVNLVSKLNNTTATPQA